MNYYVTDSELLPSKHCAISPVEALRKEFALMGWNDPCTMTIVWRGNGYCPAPIGLYCLYQISKRTYDRLAMTGPSPDSVIASYHISADSVPASDCNI